MLPLSQLPATSKYLLSALTVTPLFMVRLPEIYKFPSIDLVPEPAKIKFPKFEALII